MSPRARARTETTALPKARRANEDPVVSLSSQRPNFVPKKSPGFQAGRAESVATLSAIRK